MIFQSDQRTLQSRTAFSRCRAASFGHYLQYKSFFSNHTKHQVNSDILLQIIKFSEIMKSSVSE